MTQQKLAVFLSRIQQIPRLFLFLGLLPFSTLIPSIGPPFSAVAVIFFTEIACAAAILLVFLFTDKRKTRKWKWFFLGSFILTVLLTLLYTWMLIGFVFDTPRGEQRVMGFSYINDDVADLIRDQYSSSDWKALQEHNYKPADIWTRSSINIVILGLVLLWVAMFACGHAALAYLAISFGWTRKPVS
jgi:hypothetical protein